jgi:hypothetical protein
MKVYALVIAGLVTAGCTPAPATDGDGGPSIDGPPPDAHVVPSDAQPPPDAHGPPPDAHAMSPDAAIGDGDPDAAPVLPGVPPEIDGLITINEFMTLNAVTILDDTGVSADWLELYNPTAVDIPLAGYGLTDNLAVPARAVVPAGVVLPAGGYLVLWLDHSPELGPTHLAFGLAREGGDIGLTRPDGSDIDRITYGLQEVDFSAAREPDGSDHWRVEWHPTPGAANPAGPGAPVGVDVPLAPPEVVPAAGDRSAQILDYDVLLELEIVISPAGVAALEEHPFTDVPGTLIYDGRAYGPVGVRLKGQNSFQPISQKPSLRINIDEYVPRAKFFGLKDLTLNNMDNDLSMMHERLAYLVARAAGVPASRANHTLLTVNGELYGLYVNIETVKRRMVSRWFADATGPLFEGTDVDFTAEYVGAYELESGPDDRTALAGLAAALTIADPDAAIAAASAYVDLAELHRFWAVCAVVGQYDSFPYSTPGDDIMLYVDPGTGLLTIMPWGMDETFYSSSHDVLAISSILAQKCLASSACLQGWVDQIWDVLAMTEAMDLEAERAAVAAEIGPYVALDTNKPYSTETVLDYQGAMRWFVIERRLHLTEMLPPPSP